MTNFRVVTDALGKMNVPEKALWGASTQRAIENFRVSGRRFPKSFIRSLTLIKKCAAEANLQLGQLDKNIAKAIVSAADEICKGEHYDEFPLDIYQTGSATSTNMNANEVIANLANRKLGGEIGSWKPVHPNDHVNKCQSSNDVIPSTIHVTASLEIRDKLIPALRKLTSAFTKKAAEFKDVIKIGRTHLMDAMPMTLGDEFGGYARQVELGLERIERSLPSLYELAIGGTAIGTGFGAHPKFSKTLCKIMSEATGVNFKPAKNYFTALSSQSQVVEISGAIKALATSLIRIAEDIRLIASGPRLGLNEIMLPALQPGSSIMPGKVNPVIPEMVIQVGNQVIANDLAVTLGAKCGHLELNTQLPLLASNLLESIEIIAGAADSFGEKCVLSITANRDNCRRNVEMSLSLVTALVPKIGYIKSAEIAHEAFKTRKSVRKIALEQKVASEKELDELFDVEKMV